MNKIKSILIFLILISLFYCRQGEEVLATYNGGQIQRKSLRLFYELNDFPKNEKTLSIASQKMILDQMANMQLLELELKDKKPYDRDDVKNILYFLERGLVVNLYLKNFYEKKKDSESLDLADIQFALLPGGDSARLETIRKELSELNNDDKIEEYMSRVTIEEGRKCVGGHLEPQCINCGGQDQVLQFFMEGIQKNDSNFYISENGSRSFVYRINKRKNVSSSDLESYLTKKFNQLRDKAIEYTNKNNNETEKQNAQYYLEESPRLEEKAKLTAAHFLKGFQSRVIEEEIRRLETEKKLKLGDDIIKNPQILEVPDTVILNLPDRKYTATDLNSDFTKIFPGEQKNPIEKLNFLRAIIIPSFLVADSEDGEKIKKSENFEIFLNYHKQKLLFDVFRNDLGKEASSITDKELMEVYEAGKQFQFSKVDEKNPDKKITIPFEEVKNSILQDLKNKEIEGKFQGKINSLRETYKLEILVDKLKEGNI